MGVPVTFVLQCIKQHFGKKVNGTTVHFYGEFDGAYLQTYVILEIHFKWMRFATSPATIRKLQYVS